MTGLRQRVTVGFMSIVGVLILSGLVSYFELSTLSDETDNILNANKRNRELANDMRAALQRQNNAFVQMTAFANNSYDSICLSSLDKLDVVLFEAHAESRTPYVLDSMMATSTQLRDITMDYIATVNQTMQRISAGTLFENTDSTYQWSGAEYYAAYLQIHDKMVTSIDQYVTLAQSALAPRTEQLHNNAYRAVTPVLISLIVMIVIVLMLFYFMLMICVNPIVAITRSLKEFVAFKIPFTQKHTCRDELAELSSLIEGITNENTDLKRSKE